MKRYEVLLKVYPIIMCDTDDMSQAVEFLKEFEINDMKSGDWEYDKYIISDNETEIISSNAGYKENFYKLRCNEWFCFVDDTNSVYMKKEEKMPYKLKGNMDKFNTFDAAKEVADIVWEHLSPKEKENRRFFFVGKCTLKVDPDDTSGVCWQPDEILYDYKTGTEYNISSFQRRLK